MTASGTVLILTPLKDATAHVDGYLANLRRLTYPNKRISLGLLESDSADETYLAFEQRVPDLRTKFRSIGLWKRDFGYRLPTHVHRWAQTVQVMRRAVLARNTRAPPSAICAPVWSVRAGRRHFACAGRFFAANTRRERYCGSDLGGKLCDLADTR